MRVLQLTAHFSPNLGGVETHLDDLVIALNKRKISVFVLTYMPLISKISWKLYEKRKDLTIFRIPWMRGFFYGFKDRPILEFLYLAPPLFVCCPIALLFWNIDVIHAHGLIASFVAVFWGKLFNKKVVVTTHSVYSFPQKGFYSQFARWIFVRADKILTLSKQSRREIVELGVPKNKVWGFTYWIDLNKFNLQKSKLKVKKEFGLEKKFVVLFVGRLVEEKGVGVLLESARNWGKNIILVVVGDGPKREEFNKTHNPNIIYAGRVEQDRLPSYYHASDVVIVPSIHEEGFGRVILESLACGTPVIGSKRGGILEAMDTSVGVFIRATPKDITKAVVRLLSNPKILAKLSRKTRPYASERYSERNVESIIKSYG